MTYMYGVAASVADIKTFAEAGKGWMSNRLVEMGALRAGAFQIVMGGPGAGTVAVGIQTETADAAMELNVAIYQDPEIVKILQDTGVQVNSRTLGKIQVDIGNSDAEYIDMIAGTGMPPSEEEWQRNFDVFWSKMEGVSTGMRGIQMISNGASPVTAMGVAYGNSVDEMLAASAEAWMDPAIQESMAAGGGSMSRVIGRILF